MASVHPAPLPQPSHPLDHWLDPELARVSPPNAPSRLRQLADAQGTLSAAWSSAIGMGPVLILAGAFITAMTGAVAAVLVPGLLGAVLLVLGLVFWKRVRSALPDTSRTLISRGPGSARGGLIMAGFLAAVLGAVLAAIIPGAAPRGPTTVTGLVGAYVLFVLLLVACIVVPSTVQGRARESFRKRATADPELRSLLEQDLATWRDPVGNASYGPL
ncbi:type IV secretory pathway TrbD component [Arthrobacter woluwensis]|uniref:hypothetical protein n=1 Tax=Arthrobacter woluwensis TaxID=156980 RepID=UPI00277D6A94|nr:hypothetical protein [Arthrobacter woluwensis]MDQ0709586.1 type IV secretory pathway TrbD component [Arthrobacter woluwensis]